MTPHPYPGNDAMIRGQSDTGSPMRPKARANPIGEGNMPLTDGNADGSSCLSNAPAVESGVPAAGAVGGAV